MGKFILLLVCFFAVLRGAGQNLVPNPSFEEYNTCPNINPDIGSSNNWINPTGYSPDYFNSCDPNANNYSIPENAYGFQFAKSGVAYAGMITYAGGGGN